jgi:RNA 2',3'-cyclic 3'-phosphodiesterase
VRLFFAAFPGPEVRRRIESAARMLDLPSDARLVPAENYHVTLAFAGDVSNAQAAALRSIGAAVRSSVFDIRLDLYEYWAGSAVLVAAASELPPALAELHRLLHIEFDRLGVRAGTQPFHPHLTLARKVTQEPVLKAVCRFCWSVNAFQLVRSARSAAGSVYTVVDQWPLLDSGLREP